MSRAWFLVLASVSVGCFAPKAFEDTEGAGEATSAETDPTAGTGGTDGPSTGPTATATATDPTTATGPGDSGSGSDTGPAGDDPPLINAFTVNGSATPEDVTRSSLLVMEADATDDNGVASVEFYEGDTLLGTVTEAPFVLEVLVTSSQTGGHVYHAVATDTVDQTAVSDDVQLVVAVSGGEIVDVNEGLVEGCVSLGYFGGMTFISPSRLVLATTGCGEPTFESTFFVADDNMEILSSSAEQPGFAMTPTTLDDGRVLIPTSEPTGNFSTAVWRYNVFDPQLGAVEPNLGPQYSGIDEFSPVAVTVPGEGVFLARNGSEVALLEPDFDVAVWTDDLGLGDETADLRARALGADGEVFISVAADACPSVSTACVVKFDSSGSRLWTRPLQTGLFHSGLASDDQGGVFYALATTEGFLVAHLNADGDEVASELLSFENPRSTFPRIVRDGQGGIVVAGATGIPDNTGQIPGDESILLRLDASLQEAWRVTGVGPGQSRAVALGNDSAGGLIVAGIRTPGGENPTLFAIEGQVWLARANF